MLNENSISPKQNSLPWWTWIAPFFLIELGNQLSLLFRYDTSFSAFYLPTAVAIVLIFWWGPARVLPVMFIESTYNSWFYNIQTYWLWPSFGLAETTAVFLSWFFFYKILKGKIWLPDTRHTILFLAFGIVIPIVFEVTIWEFLYLYEGKLESGLYWTQFSRDLLSELIVGFCFMLPAIYFLTPIMNSKGYLIKPISSASVQIIFEKKHLPELFISFVILTLLTFTLTVEVFWLITGLFSLYFAIRFGFGMALIGNTYIFFISYLLPPMINNLFNQQLVLTNSIDVYLGSCLLFLFAAITGRVITDLKIIRKRLYAQNLELKETNQELDRFVYSVSHDLSAPLKSILGLVNVSKLNNDPEEHKLYFNKIEASVAKLDDFIKEVLDYARNKRLESTREQFRLEDLCTEILESLKHMEGYQNIDVDLSNLKLPQIETDKTRMRIILNNLLTNSIKYQKRLPEHRTYIRISSRKNASAFIIEIEDNGEGIKPEVQKKIFNMFYRGHEKSKGSGLGLYIAREAAERINGTIAVKSVYGVGSTFTLEIKDQHLN